MTTDRKNPETIDVYVLDKGRARFARVFYKSLLDSIAKDLAVPVYKAPRVDYFMAYYIFITQEEAELVLAMRRLIMECAI